MNAFNRGYTGVPIERKDYNKTIWIKRNITQYVDTDKHSILLSRVSERNSGNSCREKEEKKRSFKYNKRQIIIINNIDSAISQYRKANARA